MRVKWQATVERADAVSPSQRIDLDLLVKALTGAYRLQTTANAYIPVPPERQITVSATFPPPPQVSLEVAGVRLADRDFPGVSHSENIPIPSPWSFQLPIPQQLDLEAVRNGDPNAVANYGWALAAPYLQSMGQALQAFRYVGPDRFVDHSVFALGSSPVDNPRSADQVIDTLVYNKDVLRRVSRRCERVFGYSIDVELIPNRQVSLVAFGRDDLRHNIVNLGSGLVQFVWVVLQLELALQRQARSDASQVATVGIDEPELHLHPAIQPDIARVLVDYVREGSQVICTTQSEHFLMALLQMVLEASLSPTELSVYYVDRGRAQRLTVDEQGRLSEGLRGFFEANEEQLRERLELLMRRA